MTRTVNEVESTVPIGGNLVMRVVDVDVSNYDDEAGSDGEALTPQDLGLSRRAVAGWAEVIGAGSASGTAMEGVSAQYRPNDGQLRLYHSGGADGEMAEMTSNNNEGAKVRVVAIGV